MTAKLEPFFNRLTKNSKHLGKWARRVGMQCYRLYDNDIPGTPLAVDLYENFVHVAEYERDHGMTLDEHADWLSECLEVISKVLDIHSSSIYLKYRQRQKGVRQYERFSREGAEFIVRENNLKFIVNYFDTGTTKPRSKPRKPYQITLKKIVLNNIGLKYKNFNTDTV